MTGKGGGGLNPYGQPDRKNTVFFMTFLSKQVLCSFSVERPQIYDILFMLFILDQHCQTKVSHVGHTI